MNRRRRAPGRSPQLPGHARRWITSGLVLALLAGSSAAQAAAATAAQVRSLAAQAASGDASALAELKTITAIDGQPAHLQEALATGNQTQLRTRLSALAALPQASNPLSNPGSIATSLLSGSRFKGPPVPDPIQSALKKLSDALVRLAERAPGGSGVFWGVSAAVVLALALLGARRMIRRLEPTDMRATDLAGGPAGEDPATLEREANAAEGQGDFAQAIRLRFRAGLLRLLAPDYSPSLLTAEVARRLRSPRFDALASTFDRVTYGGSPASASDAQAAREGWRTLLREAAASR